MENNKSKAHANSIRDLKRRKLKSASELPASSPNGGILKSEVDRRHSIEKDFNSKKNRALRKKAQQQEVQYNFSSNGYGNGNLGGQERGGGKQKKKKKGKRGGGRR